MCQGYGVWHATTVKNDDIDVRELGPIATPTRRPLHVPLPGFLIKKGCEGIDGDGHRRPAQAGAKGEGRLVLPSLGRLIQLVRFGDRQDDVDDVRLFLQLSLEATQPGSHL